MFTIKIITAAVLFAFYFIDMARIPKKLQIDVKPFNCMMCLSAWVAAILFFCPGWAINLVLAVFAAGVSAPLVKNFIHNLYFKK